MNEQLISKKSHKAAPYFIIDKADSMVFYDDLKFDYHNDFDRHKLPPYFIKGKENRNERSIAHSYPDLVGTLDKCKFTLNQDAKDKGVFDNSNVKVFERDFIHKHLQDGIINPNDQYTMIYELKMDGVSVEAKIKNGVIIEAHSRGDTTEDVANDWTPFLEGYQFPKAIEAGLNDEIGIKFEAIITKYNLAYLASAGIRYVNCRNAIIGISSRLDARQFQNIITLVPLKTSLQDPLIPDTHLDRLIELEVMNKYFTRDVRLPFSTFTGNYWEVCLMTQHFVEEAEYMRQFLPFMYDGIVVSYYDEKIKRRLGRENHVDKYSVAIKFSPLEATTVFLGYSFTIGKNGTITPMINYRPVEFYGAIHNKSSGHSYKRFQELGLRMGDIIKVEYMNDVMPYVTKADVVENDYNPNPIIQFPDKCPCCGSKIEVSPSMKSAKCTNVHCPAREVARMTSMLSMLNIRNFSEATVQTLQDNLKISSLKELFTLQEEDVRFLGPENSKNFIKAIEELRTTPMYDYQILGALGFSNTAKAKWKLICDKLTIEDLLGMHEEDLYSTLINIKGLGKETANIIATERDDFVEDILAVCNFMTIRKTKGLTDTGKIIRFTGVRNKELCDLLNQQGHDAGEGAVSKKTDFLIVPFEGYTSTKTKKASEYGIPIMSMENFVHDMAQLLS